MEYTNSNPSPEKEYILSVLARNRAGVLLRIAGLFSRRCYNILSIVAAQTEDTEYSRILIVVSGDDRIVRQVDKQLSKLIDIVQVDVLEREKIVEREHLLLKVERTLQTSEKLVEIANIFRANVVDVGKNSLTVEATGTASKLDAMEDLFRSYGIRQLTRTGKIAMSRGSSDR